VRRIFARHVRDVYRDASLSLEIARGAAGLRGRRVRRQGTRCEGNCRVDAQHALAAILCRDVWLNVSR
jgi:hypothetical protein